MQVAKYLKGEIKIQILKRNYNFWETITGTFRLHAKKAIRGEDLSVHLVAYKRESSYGKDGKKHSTKKEFARYSTHIESGVNYEIGLKRDYDISIVIPSSKEVFGNQNEMDFWDTTLWKLASFALKNVRRTQLTWQIQVDLEAEWLDIHGKKDIFVTKNID